MPMDQNSSPYSISQWIKSLHRISEMILFDGKLDVTTDAILEILNTHLGAYAAIYLVVDEAREHLVLRSFTQNKMVERVLKAIPFDVISLKYPLHMPEKETTIVQCIKENKIIQKKNLSDFFHPVFSSKKLLDKLQKIIGLRMCVAAPVRIKQEPIGVFFVVTKKTEFTPDELELLQFYSNISGISYENHHRLQQLAQKYEMERETTSLLGHEIKTPIAIAYNNTQLLHLLLKKNAKKMGSSLDEFKKIEMRLKAGLQHMNQLCHSILSLREIENNILTMNQQLEVKFFLSQLINNFRKKAKAKGLTLQCSYKIKPGVFYGGGAQFEQVVTILLDNAIKYTEKGGIDVMIKLDGKTLECSVKDTGFGISEEEKKKIFHRYYRIKNPGKSSIHGLGIGLYIARKIVDALQGSLIIKDNKNYRGTEFIVTIPVYKTKSAKFEA